MIPKVAIVNFGLSYMHGQGKPSHGRPRDFAAPEILLEGPKDANDISSDIWALVCTILAVFAGYSPFQE